MSVPTVTIHQDSPLFSIDVAHPPRHPDAVEQELVEAWSHVRNSSSLRILKIVHGRGSRGNSAKTRDGVRNWAFSHRDKFRLVIEGERYTVWEPAVREMRKEVGQYTDDDLNSANPGITLIWVR